MPGYTPPVAAMQRPLPPRGGAAPTASEDTAGQTHTAAASQGAHIGAPRASTPGPAHNVNRSQAQGERAHTRIRPGGRINIRDRVVEPVSDEVDMYVSTNWVDFSTDEDFNLIDWWHKHSEEMPFLSRLALSILCVPVSNASGIIRQYGRDQGRKHELQASESSTFSKSSSRIRNRLSAVTQRAT